MHVRVYVQVRLTQLSNHHHPRAAAAGTAAAAGLKLGSHQSKVQRPSPLGLVLGWPALPLCGLPVAVDLREIVVVVVVVGGGGGVVVVVVVAERLGFR